MTAPPPRRRWRTDDEWTRLRARVEAAQADPIPQRGHGRAWVLAAAAAIIVAAAGITWQRSTRETQTVAQHFATRAGERRTVHLSDSSVVTLGPASSLTVRFASSSRHVELSGLADFVVTHNAKRPFVVRTAFALTEDLGTEFTIRAYPDDSLATVFVSSGRVAVRDQAQKGIAELSGGQAATVSAAGDVRHVTSTSTEGLAWLQGNIAFNDVTVAEAAKEISRWFGVSIDVQGKELAERRVTAQYVRPTLTDVLGALAVTLHARIEQNQRTITLTAIR